MIFVVLGMHKSGTTMLARALHESGIPMGQDFSPGVEYAKAKYEARWVQEINDEILGASRQELSLRVTSELLPENGIEEVIKEKMESGIDYAQARHPDWGFKDPRTTLTYAHWKDHLPEHRLVVIYRNPAEVWKRYASIGWASRFRLPFKSWCDYNKSILLHLKESPRRSYILLEFERLLSTDEEWDRLSKFVGLDLINVRDPSQSVNRISGWGIEAQAYRALMLLLGRESAKIYSDLEALREQDT